MAEKYYDFSTYMGLGDNPVKYVDIDGREIVIYHVVDYLQSGGNDYVEGQTSKNTQAALNKFVKTKEGRAFLAQFAEKGQEVGGYTFTEDGKYADQHLVITDYSFQEYKSRMSKPATNEGSFTTTVSPRNHKKTATYINIFSNDKSVNQILKIMAHEMGLHGYKAKYNVEKFKKGGKKELEKYKASDPGGEKDHKALNDHNMKHEGYRMYRSIMEELKLW